ncbi:mif4g domain-containing protein [Cyclospora cayetanensis]|uniref:Mif4g domain-containing protein n=1 Tax=Cyclospora cayetanensis TaxID=88456 RepID=A0A1D3CZH4_9EIME|nr:mif4g domain-containing protein [Cyclospora cayetanensis]
MRFSAILCVAASAALPVLPLKLDSISKDEGQAVFSVNTFTEIVTPLNAEGDAVSPEGLQPFLSREGEAEEVGEALAEKADDDSAELSAENTSAAFENAATETEDPQDGVSPEDSPNLAVFAPRNFRFFDSARGKVLNVFFHNAFEPFDRVACYELSESPSVCVEHPRCSMQEGQASKSPRCALSNAYLSLAASSLCHRAVESVESPSVQKEELQAVILDLMNELGVEPMPLMTALQEAGASNAESICELAKACL